MWAVTAAATPLIALTAWQALTAASELRGQIVVVIALFSAVLVAGGDVADPRYTRQRGR